MRRRRPSGSGGGRAAAGDGRRRSPVRAERRAQVGQAIELVVREVEDLQPRQLLDRHLGDLVARGAQHLERAELLEAVEHHQLVARQVELLAAERGGGSRRRRGGGAARAARAAARALSAVPLIARSPSVARSWKLGCCVKCER